MRGFGRGGNAKEAIACAPFPPRQKSDRVAQLCEPTFIADARVITRVHAITSLHEYSRSYVLDRAQRAIPRNLVPDV